MQKITLLLAFAITTLSCKSQNTAGTHSEFNQNTNGLIYSEADISTLRFVVDSLNLKFKTCDLDKAYLSYPQTKAYSIRFKSEKNDLTDIIHELFTDITPSDLSKQYESFIDKTDSSVLVVASYIDDKGKQEYLFGNPYSGFDNQYMLRGKETSSLKGWQYDYSEKDEYTKYYSLTCFYFSVPMAAAPIPTNYGRLIQYVDCMVDTSATIFLTEKYSGRFYNEESMGKEYNELLAYVNKKMGIKNSGDNYTYDLFTGDKLKYLQDSLSKDEWAVKKAKSIVEWCLNKNTSNDAVEDIAAAFVSKQKALELKRHRRVMGGCSQDQSPRIHALNIAKLAAETHSWDIFLRSHLNIMNDRFERMTDGSYAWGQRKTYIKELEALDINVIDMMLGLSLRASNSADNHYNGTVWRIGKALSESKDRLLFEQKVKEMMKDEALDEFNRSLMFLLYYTYLNYLDDRGERKQKVKQMKAEATSYPLFIQKAIEQMKAEIKEKD